MLAHLKISYWVQVCLCEKKERLFVLGYKYLAHQMTEVRVTLNKLKMFCQARARRERV